MRGLLRLGLTTGSALLGVALTGWLAALAWLPIWLMPGHRPPGLATALLLWLTLTALGFGLAVGGWIGWHLIDRWRPLPETLECGRALDSDQRGI